MRAVYAAVWVLLCLSVSWGSSLGSDSRHIRLQNTLPDGTDEVADVRFAGSPSVHYVIIDEEPAIAAVACG